MKTQQIMKKEFIQKFNSLSTEAQKELLTKAQAHKWDLKDFSRLDAQEVAMNFMDGQEVINDVWSIMGGND